MTIQELMMKLAKMFPGSYSSPEGAIEWGNIYREALGKFEGRALKAGYEETLARWTNGYAPKPAEFVPACVSAQHRGDDNPNGPRWGRIGEEIRRIKPAVIDSWWCICAETIDEFLASFPEDDRSCARFHLSEDIRNRAHDVAMRRAQGSEAVIQFEPEDYDRIRRRVASRMPKASQKDLRRMLPKFLRDGPRESPPIDRAMKAGKP